MGGWLYSKGSTGWTSIGSEELQEKDVWDCFQHERVKELSSSTVQQESAASSCVLRLMPTAAKMIPRTSSNQNPPPTHEPKIIQHSAPVIIPDWSKIYQTGSNQVTTYTPPFLSDNYDHSSQAEDEGCGFVRGGWDSGGEDEKEDDEFDDGLILPPHEWLGRRKISGSKIFSVSVFEGAGTTLKWRDLSRLRNAVWTKTGFLEL
ncbi:unnamed protein product [Cuscuta epithymum]|uniref:Uncharacterized protein n=1 Tax=Cuscuta epithymum TaxID=186058 RepID=A0AAV0C169_9ASTE|nr:unnamed protein product [Cuscuta epithymum]CAH9123388.1 unnamed protein product [Cuscuta epithymum]CAH9128801.1 unnamed protein product [Cuscuta epithymum]